MIRAGHATSDSGLRRQAPTDLGQEGDLRSALGDARPLQRTATSHGRHLARTWGFIMDLDIQQLRWSVATLLALITAACGGSGTDQTTVPDDPTTVTSADPDPVTAEIQVYEGTLNLNDEMLPAFQDITMHVGDEVEAGDGEAHGMIRLGNEYTIELFMGASLSVVTLDPPELGIYLNGGHIAVVPTDRTSSQLKVETKRSDLKTVGGGAEFTLCQPPTGNTCLLVERGIVEMTAEGATRTYMEREDTAKAAIFLETDKPPGEEHCVSGQTYDDWFELARVNDAEEPLSALVRGSPWCEGEEERTTVEVPSTQVWTDSGIDLEVGDIVKIDGFGTVKHGENTDHYSPEGNPNTPGRNNVPGAEEMNHSALIGKIGETGEVFLVGREHQLTVATAGRLHLGVNDTDAINNEGTFVANVTVIRAPTSS